MKTSHNFYTFFPEKLFNLPIGSCHLISCGQAGFIVHSPSGKLFGIDLFLSNCLERYDGFKRLIPFLIDPNTLCLDYLVATHCHFDHFDIDAMPSLMKHKKTHLFASQNCKNVVNQLAIANNQVTYISVGDSFSLGDMTMRSVFCDHGEAAPDAVGIILTVEHINIYFVGDSCLRLDYVPSIIGNTPIDILIGPINGKWGNLNEEELISLTCSIKPSYVIPCHYWCFAEHGGNPGLFAERIQTRLPEQKYKIMALGEILELPLSIT